MYTVRAVEDAGPYKMIKGTGSMNRSLFVEKPGCAIQEATGFLAYSE